ncbi:hypothetical protein D0Y65_053409, partial [Glycine soja]
QLQFYVSKFAIFQVCATLDITEGVNNINIFDSYKKNRIQVSNSKQPLFFYVNLAKRYMQQRDEVELSALGMGIEIPFAFFPLLFLEFCLCWFYWLLID